MLRYLVISVVCLQTLSAQMTPNAPVKNFRLPRFGDNGYTQWVLQGGEGIYDNAEQTRIKDMALRVYSGDERMALEMSLDSPEATLRVAENRAFSDSTIVIVGANFRISGVGWTWDGETKEIEVLFDTVVEFTQAISESLGSEGAVEAGAAPKTVIHSERLKLLTTETEYHFDFTNNVHAVSGDMDLTSNVLIALVDAPEGRKEGSPKVEAGQLDSVRQIVARDSVVINQAGRVVRAGEAEFFPREKRVQLTGTPQIETPGAYLSGHTIRSREGEIVIVGGGDAGRAQMILTETGGLGIQGGGALSAETIVLADKITMQELEKENLFLFEGSVAVMSGSVQLRSDLMTIYANKDTKAAKSTTADPAAEEGDLKVGEVRRIVAEGSVKIEQSGQFATSDTVTFFPAEERAVLEGDPRVTNGEAVITGEKMELKPGLAIIYGSDAERVKVVLPEMQDLGYKTFTGVTGVATVEETTTANPAKETVVESNMLRMIEEPTQTVFRFSENVTIVATNLDAKCDRLDVIAADAKSTDMKTGKMSDRLEVLRIEALDNVEVRQDGRLATAEKGFILPQEGKVILEGNAVVNDDRGRVSGHRIILLQGQRRAIVEGGGPEKERARITLPAIPSGKL
ncbi:MAG: LptA/OstA family protein [Opitutaceae bacterium]